MISNKYHLFSRVAFSWICALLCSFAAASEFPSGTEIISEGYKFPEGPAVDRNGVLFFSDANDNKIYKWDGKAATLFVEDSGKTNGLAFHKDGTLYGCATSLHAIVKFDASGRRSVVLDQLDGAPLNAPNDLAFDSHGNLFFTNPAGFGGKPGIANVVRLRPDGTAKIVAADTAYPNGIDISPDGKFLFVTDTMGGNILWRYPLEGNGEVGAGEKFKEFGTGVLDGIALAASGNIFVAVNAMAKIVVLSPTGAELSTIQFPPGSQISNLCFAGDDMKTMFITMGGVGAKGRVARMPAPEAGLPLWGQK